MKAGIRVFSNCEFAGSMQRFQPSEGRGIETDSPISAQFWAAASSPVLGLAHGLRHLAASIDSPCLWGRLV